MANVVGDIAIQVGADIGPLVRELGKGSAAVTKFGADAQKGGAGMALATKAGIALGAAVVGAGVALAAMTKASMDSIDALSKQARVAGVSVATFQAMAQVAEEAGVSSEQLSKSLVKMQDNIANLSRGTSAQVAAFGQLGLSAADFVGLGADQQFALLAEKISGIADPTMRTAAALDVFGKSGADALNMMTGYGAAIADASAFQREFGLAVSDLDAANIEAANDAMGRTEMAIGSLGTTLAVTFAPAIETVALGLAALVNDLFGAQTAMEQVFGTEGIAKAILGAEIYDQLIRDADAFRENATAIGELKGVMQALGTVSGNTADMLDVVADNLSKGNFNVLSRDIGIVATNMRKLNSDFADGIIGAEEYGAKMAAAKARAAELLGLIEEITGIDMSEAVAELAGLGSALDSTRVKAQALAMAMTAAGATGSGVHTGENVYQSPLAPSTSPRPGQRPMDLGDYGASGGGVGSGGGGPQLDLQALQEKYASESELAQMHYEESLAELATFREAKLLTEQQYNEMERQAKEEHETALAEIEAKVQSERLDAIGGAFGDLASLMATGNEKLFKIGQAAAIGKAIVDGYEAAVSAWKHGMSIGGPGLAAAFTAASLAKTGALIAGIASANSRGGSQSSGGGASSSGGAAAASAVSRGPLEVRLNTYGGGDNIKASDLGALLDMLGKEAGDRGYRIMVPA